LNQKTKDSLIEYSSDQDVHSTLQLTFGELLVMIWDRIRRLSDPEGCLRVLESEMSDAFCMCFTGRITRLVNCLNGFDPEVIIKISDNEQISYLVEISKGDKTKFIEMMKERGYPQETIDIWTADM
jgi:hypothetical protein